MRGTFTPLSPPPRTPLFRTTIPPYHPDTPPPRHRRRRRAPPVTRTLHPRQAGITKWSEIAARTVGRIGKQCRERWFNHLDPTLKKNGWTEEDDELLVGLQVGVVV